MNLKRSDILLVEEIIRLHDETRGLYSEVLVSKALEIAEAPKGMEERPWPEKRDYLQSWLGSLPEVEAIQGWDDDFSKGVFWLVEADSDHYTDLWKEWNEKILWADHAFGRQLTIGYLQPKGKVPARPVTLLFRAASIGGKRVLFWECISQLADHWMIEAFFTRQFPNIKNDLARRFHEVVYQIQHDTQTT